MSEEKEEDIALAKFRKIKDEKNGDVVHISDATERLGEYTTPYPTGFPIFDNAIKGGVREGNLIGVTGRPGMGKTTFTQNISVHLSKQGMSSLWFCYEGLIDDIYAKFLSMGMTKENLKIFVPKKLKSGNTEWIMSKIIEGVEKYGSKFVFIDHLDFLTPRKKSSDELRVVIKDICLDLVDIAKELNVVIFLISHVKKVQGRAIELEDFAESMALPQLASACFTVDREVSYEEISGLKTAVFKNNNGTVRMLKNRIGSEHPVMFFSMENNTLSPYDFSEKQDAEPSLNIEVVDDSKKDEEVKPLTLFGDKS